MKNGKLLLTLTITFSLSIVMLAWAAPATLLTTQHPMFCPHGGKVTGIPTSGNDKLTVADTFVVSNCPARTCERVRWTSTSTVRINGKQALDTQSKGTAVNAINVPQGLVVIKPAPVLKSQ